RCSAKRKTSAAARRGRARETRYSFAATRDSRSGRQGQADHKQRKKWVERPSTTRNPCASSSRTAAPQNRGKWLAADTQPALTMRCAVLRQCRDRLKSVVRGRESVVLPEDS